MLFLRLYLISKEEIKDEKHDSCIQYVPEVIRNTLSTTMGCKEIYCKYY